MSEKTGRAEATHRERAALGSVAAMPANWPRDEDGNYLAIVGGSCSDLVPTVQFGNVLIGPVTIQRPIAAGSLQEIIDGARETQRAAEFVVGAERRLLQWAIDPASKIASPVDAQDAFASPPPGYDKNQLGDPRDSPLGAPVVDPQAAPAAPATPQGDQQTAQGGGPQFPPGATTTIPGDGGTPTA